jgi:hypothetical protein
MNQDTCVYEGGLTTALDFQGRHICGYERFMRHGVGARGAAASPSEPDLLFRNPITNLNRPGKGLLQ